MEAGLTSPQDAVTIADAGLAAEAKLTVFHASEVVSKVLYPNDNFEAGKELRERINASTGKLEVETDDEGEANKFKLLVDEARPIADVRAERTQKVLLKLTLEQLTNDRILRLKQIVADNGGPCTMELIVTSERFGADIVFGDKFSVRADDGLVHALERLFGEKVAFLV